MFAVATTHQIGAVGDTFERRKALFALISLSKRRTSQPSFCLSVDSAAGYRGGVSQRKAQERSSETKSVSKCRLHSISPLSKKMLDITSRFRLVSRKNVAVHFNERMSVIVIPVFLIRGLYSFSGHTESRLQAPDHRTPSGLSGLYSCWNFD